MLRYLRLLARFARVDLQYELEYRANLVVELVEMAVVIATSIGAVLILFTYTQEINGWTLAEMLVLLGVFYVVQGVEETLFQPSAEKLMEHVRMGTLDFTLLKPVNSQFLASLRHLQLVQVAQIAVGAGVIATGVAELGGNISIGAALAFALTLACGVCLVYAILLSLATLSFWFVRVDNILAIFWAFLDAGRFPVDVYPGWLRVTMTTIVPIGVAVTVPAQALAGRLEPLGLLAVVGGTGLALAFARWFWQRGLRSYTGASA